MGRGTFDIDAGLPCSVHRPIFKGRRIALQQLRWGLRFAVAFRRGDRCTAPGDQHATHRRRGPFHVGEHDSRITEVAQVRTPTVGDDGDESIARQRDRDHLGLADDVVQLGQIGQGSDRGSGPRRLQPLGSHRLLELRLSPTQLTGRCSGELGAAEVAGDGSQSSEVRRRGIVVITSENFDVTVLGNLVAWYRFENDALDSSGHANHGVLNGGTSFVAGRMNV